MPATRSLTVGAPIMHSRYALGCGLQPLRLQGVHRFICLLLMVAPGTSWSQSVRAESVLEGGSPRTLAISLKQAVELALAPQGNVRVQLAEELIRQAQARWSQSRAALLPNLDASVSQQNQTRNLTALGIRIVIPI